MKRWLGLIMGLLFLAWLATSLYQVAPGEWAVVSRFGKPLEELRGPGLHWGLPWGLDRITKVAVDEQRQLLVGYVEEIGPGDSLAPQPAIVTGQALTGDHQIVNIRISLLYRIDQSQLIAYVVQRDRMEEILQRLAEETMTETLASQKIDQVLLGRAIRFENQMRDSMLQRIQRYRMGILLDSVNVTLAQPPSELVEIFRDVNRARSQRDIAITDATSRKQTDVSQARQQAERTTSLARSTVHNKIAQAQAEAAAFRGLLATMPTSEPGLSAALLQLYLGEMQSILSRMQVRTLSDQGVEQVVVMPLPVK